MGACVGGGGGLRRGARGVGGSGDVAMASVMGVVNTEKGWDEV